MWPMQAINFPTTITNGEEVSRERVKNEQIDLILSKNTQRVVVTLTDVKDLLSVMHSIVPLLQQYRYKFTMSF